MTAPPCGYWPPSTCAISPEPSSAPPDAQAGSGVPSAANTATADSSPFEGSLGSAYSDGPADPPRTTRPLAGSTAMASVDAYAAPANAAVASPPVPNDASGVPSGANRTTAISDPSASPAPSESVGTVPATSTSPAASTANGPQNVQSAYPAQPVAAAAAVATPAELNDASGVPGLRPRRCPRKLATRLYTGPGRPPQRRRRRPQQSQANRSASGSVAIRECGPSPS